MKKTQFIILSIFFLLIINLNGQDQHISWEFDRPAEDSGIILAQYGEKKAPQIDNGTLILLSGGVYSNHKNTALFPEITDQVNSNIQLKWQMSMIPGAEGCGIALLNTDVFAGDSLDLNFENWHIPSLEKSFAIGFDISNPPTAAWFGPDGNYYNRPQREISLHWDGFEIIKILSPVEFRADPEEEEFIDFQLNIDYVIGGAEITLHIKDEKVFDNYFIAEMTLYPVRLALGAQTGEQTTNVYIDNVEMDLFEIKEPTSSYARINLFSEQPVYIETRDSQFQVRFPNFKSQVGRVILTLKIADMPGGYDPWDEGAGIFIWEDSVRYELCRFITPYHRGYTWKADVTDFLPLFKDEKQIDLHVDTWLQKTDTPEEQKGWLISADLDFYFGSPERIPVSISNLWNGNFEYGNPLDPMADHLPGLKVEVPEGVSDARVRIMVTGHAMYPNSQNAAEFMPADRVVYVNEHKYENTLWKTDCYLNPCRPQDGTWKFDRAGWAPGSIVEPWVIELKDVAAVSDSLKIDYVPMAYRNLSEGDHWKPHHRFESQIIFYK
jgi:peptide-N-glycosidase F-like protein